MTGVILNSAPKSSLSFLPFSMTEVHLRVRTPREETGSLEESSESSPTRLYVDPEHYHAKRRPAMGCKRWKQRGKETLSKEGMEKRRA